jgi:uncharacterized protein YjbI with pentapeptide repeats
MLKKMTVKDAIKNTVIIVSLLCIVLLGISRITANEQRLFLQKGADQIFEYNFGKLCANLNVDTSDMDEVELERYNNENTKFGYALTIIFSYTTYAGNNNLNSIVFAMNQMVGIDAIYETVNEKDVLEQLNYLSHHLDSPESAEAVWARLSVLLHKQSGTP